MNAHKQNKANNGFMALRVPVIIGLIVHNVGSGESIANKAANFFIRLSVV